MLLNKNGTLVGMPEGAFMRFMGAKKARYTCPIASTRNSFLRGAVPGSFGVACEEAIASSIAKRLRAPDAGKKEEGRVLRPSNDRPLCWTLTFTGRLGRGWIRLGIKAEELRLRGPSFPGRRVVHSAAAAQPRAASCRFPGACASWPKAKRCHAIPRTLGCTPLRPAARTLPCCLA